MCLSEIQPEPLEWLWPGRIPAGKLTLIAGDPGLGKSLLTIDVAARTSRGALWPEQACPAPRGSVILLTAEDDPADTIRPRLDAARADVSKIHLLQAIQGEGKQPTARTFSLERDIAALEGVVVKLADTKLIIIDPITAYVGGVDSHKNAEVRGLLAPLAKVAQKHRVAVVAVTHLNKSTAGPAIYRSMGSLAFVAAARSAWGVVKDKNNPTQRLFLPIKQNLSAEMTGLAYTVYSDNGIPVLAWSPEPIKITIDDAMAQDRPPRAQRREDAETWLCDLLANGPVSPDDVKSAAKEAGYTWATVRVAKDALGVRSVKEGFGRGATWKWRLPAATSNEDANGEDATTLPFQHLSTLAPLDENQPEEA